MTKKGVENKASKKLQEAREDIDRLSDWKKTDNSGGLILILLFIACLFQNIPFVIAFSAVLIAIYIAHIAKRMK